MKNFKEYLNEMNFFKNQKIKSFDIEKKTKPFDIEEKTKPFNDDILKSLNLLDNDLNIKDMNFDTNFYNILFFNNISLKLYISSFSGDGGGEGNLYTLYINDKKIPGSNIDGSKLTRLLIKKILSIF
jgi:hypothetical protein